MERLTQWCLDEIRGMEDARAHLAWLLQEMEEAAALPLLQDSLQEQRAMNAAQRERLARIYACLGVPRGGRENPVVLAMVSDARDAMQRIEGEARDIVIAQHAVRLESWELGVWTGLYSVLRQLSQHDAADEVGALIDDLRSAERHLEAVHPDVDEEAAGYEHRTTIRRHPRLPIQMGPIE